MKTSNIGGFQPGPIPSSPMLESTPECAHQNGLLPGLHQFNHLIARHGARKKQLF